MTLVGMKVTSSELSVAEAFRMLVPNPIDGKSGKFKRGKDAGKNNEDKEPHGQDSRGGEGEGEAACDALLQ